MNPGSHHGAYARQLRLALGLTQEQMGRVLGIEEKSVTRLERDPKPWTPSMQRLVRALVEVRVDELELLLASCLSSLDAMDGPRSGDQLLASQAVRHLRSNFPGASGHSRVRDVLTATARPREWVYWATVARADVEGTGQLADDEGLICRPLLNSLSVVPGYLTRLAPGDDLLLCYGGKPTSWYRLLRSRRTKAVSLLPSLPPVFRFVRVNSPLGQRLAAQGYRTQDGTLPLAGSRQRWFSCLSVRKLDRPGDAPCPREAGVRDAITPYRSLKALQPTSI